MSRTVNFQRALPETHYTVSKLRSVHEQVLLSHLVSKCGLSCDGLIPQSTLSIFCGDLYEVSSRLSALPDTISIEEFIGIVNKAMSVNLYEVTGLEAMELASKGADIDYTMGTNYVYKNLLDMRWSINDLTSGYYKFFIRRPKEQRYRTIKCTVPKPLNKNTLVDGQEYFYTASGGKIYSTASASKANTRLAVYSTAEEATQAFEALQVALNN